MGLVRGKVKWNIIYKIRNYSIAMGLDYIYKFLLGMWQVKHSNVMAYLNMIENPIYLSSAYKRL